MHGMPPHIAQLVAGHRDINTTMGYKAVYPEEVINGHRAFIARRRALRPSEEYRAPTDEEWAEFTGHFERRKVALGDCGRSYDTPCIHEHAACAARCCAPTRPHGPAWPRSATTSSPASPKPNPARWLGEAEGLKVSLAGARRQARPDGPDHRPPQRRHQPRHARLRRRRRPHNHHTGKPPASTV